MKINFNNLSAQWNTISEKVNPKLQDCLKKCNFILGEEVSIFEDKFSNYIGTKYAVGVSNGTDAITLMLKSLELKGKTAFYVSSNTYVATVFGIKHSYPDAKIFLIETSEYYLMNEKDLQSKLEKNYKKFDNNVIFPVHMYGNIGDMIYIKYLSRKFKAVIVEDSSQAHGTLHISNKKAGSFGLASAFSLYPGKNLGASGDAGIITTDNKKIYQRLLKLRNLGSVVKFKHDVIGYNNRLDTLQAIILNEKLDYLDLWNGSRLLVAESYSKNIKNKRVTLPKPSPYCLQHTYHVYNILVDNRKRFIEHLKKNNVEFNIHYPTPIEEMKPFTYLKQNNNMTRVYSRKQVSLPIHPFMSKEEIQYVIDVVNRYDKQ